MLTMRPNYGGGKKEARIFSVGLGHFAVIWKRLSEANSSNTWAGVMEENGTGAKYLCGRN